MPKPKWEKEDLDTLVRDISRAGFIVKSEAREKIKSFIRTQLEGVIKDIPDVVMLAGGDGDETSALTLKQQLRAKWLREEQE